MYCHIESLNQKSVTKYEHAPRIEAEGTVLHYKV
jgi:hypothetical protein